VTRAVAIAALLWSAWPAWGATQERSEWDFSVKSGISVGRIARGQTIAPDGITVVPANSIEYGALPMAISLNQDLTRLLALTIELHLMADFVNLQLSEVGAHMGLALHLLGGSRKTQSDLAYVTSVYRDPYNVSLIARVSLSKFNVSPRVPDPNNPFDFYNGSTFEIMGGLQYRQDTSERSAFVFEVFTTFLSIAAGNERVTTSRTEFDISYRFFL
jgi:hypothetical protein